MELSNAVGSYRARQKWVAWSMRLVFTPSDCRRLEQLQLTFASGCSRDRMLAVLCRRHRRSRDAQRHMLTKVYQALVPEASDEVSVSLANGTAGRTDLITAVQ